jgi:hypothetical protein
MDSFSSPENVMGKYNGDRQFFLHALERQIQVYRDQPLSED